MLLPVSMQAQKNTAFIPGQVWNDMDGNPINAHGGGLLYHNGTYYWYGEYKKGKTILPDWATWECYRTDVLKPANLPFIHCNSRISGSRQSKWRRITPM